MQLLAAGPGNRCGACCGQLIIFNKRPVYGRSSARAALLHRAVSLKLAVTDDYQPEPCPLQDRP
ncbi:protein of unknown function [Pseudomonas sp. JV241A]|nr:protein of unknown function [Pseudomonas sp. JV241A]